MPLPARPAIVCVLAAVTFAAAMLVMGSGRAAATAVAGRAAVRQATSAQDNITYHGSNLRLGWYAAEPILTASNVGSPAFHLIGTLPLAGKSFSQPLYLSNELVGDGTTHNLLIVTDTTDVVYAYDADTLLLVWKRVFTGKNVRQQLSSDTGCDDNWPNDGINGTPVVDRARNMLYVVVPTYANGTFALWLHALALTNGSDAVRAVKIHAAFEQPTGSTAAIDPKFNFNRAGLLEANGAIYVPLTTHCDFDSTAAHGWLLSYSADTLQRMGRVVDTDPAFIGDIGGTDYLAGIWQGGFGIAADASNNIYFTTGNGPNDGVNDFAMSVIRYGAALNPATRQFFTPSTWQNDSQLDLDLGSGGVMLLPDQASGQYVHLAIAGGKTGMKYLMNRDALGGLQSVDNVLFEQNVAGGQWGGPAYYVDANGNQKILYGGSPSLNAYTLTTAPYGLVQTSATTIGTLEDRNYGVTPVVSSNGLTPGSAVVWAVQTTAYADGGSVPVNLCAFDGSNLANVLFVQQAGRWSVNSDTGGAMVTPLVANGRVYLATDGMVSVFGIQ